MNVTTTGINNVITAVICELNADITEPAVLYFKDH